MDSNLAMIERGSSGSARCALLPARFCLHRDPPDHRDHIDLFVLPEVDAERLWTFELPGEFAATLSALANTPIFQLRLPSGDSEGLTGAAADPHASKRIQAQWPAVRKGDHRRRYWSYSGVIAPLAGQSANPSRGTLSELGRGWVEWGDSGPPPEGVPLLLRVPESQGATQDPFSQ